MKQDTLSDQTNLIKSAYQTDIWKNLNSIK